MNPEALTPEAIQALQKMKEELEKLTGALQHSDKMSKYELEHHMRRFQAKESEIKRFLRENHLMPD